MRQRLDIRRVHRQHRVKQMGQANSLSLRNQAELGSVSVEAPRPTPFDGLDTGFVVPVKKLVGDLARWRFIGEFHGRIAEPLDADHRDQAVSEDALHGCVCCKVFQFHTLWSKNEDTEIEKYAIGGCAKDGECQPAGSWPSQTTRRRLPGCANCPIEKTMGRSSWPTGSSM